MEELLISLDIGSSGARASAFTTNGHLIAEGRRSYKTYYPQTGWAEQNADDWCEAAVSALGSMVKKINIKKYSFECLALTGQCPTYLPVGRDMRPLSKALTYQDNRSIVEAGEIKAIFGDEYVHGFTGHSVQPFYILPKIYWHKKNDPFLFEKIFKVLQPSDFLLYYLTGQVATTTTHACGTLAYDLHKGSWNSFFISKIGIDNSLFPEIVLNPWDVTDELLPGIAESTGLPKSLKVIAGAPDSQCCCLGVGAIKPGILSNMSGTSTCLNNTINSPIENLFVGNYTHVVPGLFTTEVGLNTTGASLGFLAKILFGSFTVNNRFKLIEKKMTKVKRGSDPSGVIFLPYLSGGERDNQLVKGGFYNMSMGNGESDLLQAVLEGVAFAEHKRIELLEHAGCNFERMCISGGGAKFDIWNHIKSDISGLPVSAYKNVDAAELGAAMIAGIGACIFKDAAEAVEYCRPETTEYEPDLRRKAFYEEKYRNFVELERKLSVE